MVRARQKLAFVALALVTGWAATAFPAGTPVAAPAAPAAPVSPSKVLAQLVGPDRQRLRSRRRTARTSGPRTIAAWRRT